MLRAFGIGLLLIAVAVASSANAAPCSAPQIVSTAALVASARATLIALPIGDGMETDVSPAGQAAIASMKQRLADYVGAYVRCQPQTIDPKALAVGLAKLAPPAPAPWGVFVHGKRQEEDSNYGYRLDFAARRPPGHPDLLAITASFEIECGEDTALYIYAFANGGWTQVLRAQDKSYKSIGDAWANFDFAISPSDDTGRWYVLTKTVAPWCSSTWSEIRYAVMRPVAGSVEPKLLFAGSDSIWWGSEDFGTLTAAKNDFDVRFHAESIDTGIHNRVWIRRYSIDGDTIRRVPPVAVSPRDFVDEWIVRPWTEAMTWTRADAVSGLAKMHVKLASSELHDSFNYDSATRCSGPTRRYQIAVTSDESNESYYFLVSGDSDFRMDAISMKPSPTCRGPDILKSMATM